MTKSSFETNKMLVVPSSEVEKQFGILIRTQALWRTRGYLEGYGVKEERSRNNWYGWHDMAALHLATLLFKYFDIPYALAKARSDTNSILSWAQDLAGGPTSKAARFKVYASTRDGIGSFDPIENSNALKDDIDKGVLSPVSLLIDYKQLAEALPGYMKALAMQIVPE